MASDDTNYCVNFDHRAQKEFGKLQEHEQQQLSEDIKLLRSDPRRRGKRLVGIKPSLYRLRSGDYRVIYSVSGQKLCVDIYTIQRRRTTTYDASDLKTLSKKAKGNLAD